MPEKNHRNTHTSPTNNYLPVYIYILLSFSSSPSHSCRDPLPPLPWRAPSGPHKQTKGDKVA